MDRLQPFFHRRGDRQRLILYLIATGWSVPTLSRLTIGELNAIDLPDEMEIYRDRVLALLESDNADDPAFVYPNGRAMAPTDIFRIVAATTEATLGYPLSHKQFAEYVQQGAKRRKVKKKTLDIHR